MLKYDWLVGLLTSAEVYKHSHNAEALVSILPSERQHRSYCTMPCWDRKVATWLHKRWTADLDCWEIMWSLHAGKRSESIVLGNNVISPCSQEIGKYRASRVLVTVAYQEKHVRGRLQYWVKEGVCVLPSERQHSSYCTMPCWDRKVATWLHKRWTVDLDCWEIRWSLHARKGSESAVLPES